MVVVDGWEDENPLNGLGLDPPVLQVAGDIVHEQGVSYTDVLTLELHSKPFSVQATCNISSENKFQL